MQAILCHYKVINHCKEQIRTKMFQCPLLRSYTSYVTPWHLLRTRPACLSLLFFILQLKKLKHIVSDLSHVTEQVSSSTRNKSWLGITVSLLFNVSFMSAKEKTNQTNKKPQTHTSKKPHIQVKVILLITHKSQLLLCADRKLQLYVPEQNLGSCI